MCFRKTYFISELVHEMNILLFKLKIVHIDAFLNNIKIHFYNWISICIYYVFTMQTNIIMIPLKLVTYLCGLYKIKICFHINLEFAYLSGLHHVECRWTVDDPILAFLWLGNTFRYFIHLLHLFCIKIIHSVKNNFYYWWTCFHRNFGHKFTCSLFWHLWYADLLAVKLIYVYTV